METVEQRFKFFGSLSYELYGLILLPNTAATHQNVMTLTLPYQGKQNLRLKDKDVSVRKNKKDIREEISSVLSGRKPSAVMWLEVWQIVHQ